MARNSQPAASLDPSDRANQPFMVMPTTASANADAVNRIEAKRGRDSVTTPEATVGGGTGVTAVTFSHPDRGRGYLRNDRRDTDLLALAIRLGAFGRSLGPLRPGLMEGNDRCSSVVSHWNRSFRLRSLARGVLVTRPRAASRC